MTKLSFAVRRREPPLLVGPASETPRETKRLSDTDDQEILRMHVPFVFFYRGGQQQAHDHEAEEDHHDDPVAVIRRAVGEALVPYYPLAGRVREVETRKLVVDCTGEGVLFLEADADVRMAELEAADALKAPFPCLDQLLFDVPGSGGVLNCPLLLIQVTRLLCGGFVLAVRFNHTISDATGIAQYISAVAELARGFPAPTLVPAWSRDLLEARTPPNPSFPHREFDAVPTTLPPPGDMVTRTFNFTSTDIAAIKKLLPVNLRVTTTTFDVLTAALWRARTAALDLPPAEEIRFVPITNFRNRAPELALPAGYYGNACAFPTVITTTGALLAGTLAETVHLVRNARGSVTAAYARSMLDLLVLRDRPCLALANVYIVSDTRRAGFHRVDFGWGEPVYGGPADTLFMASFLVTVKNSNGDGADAVAVPVMLPSTAMDRFASEIETMLLNALP
ncbi:hypothetical protein PR202_gb24940 [Eleusine coracana subsp. coracana]|uniref:Benzyl alcohol O-benzoyltransferase n=1 Tax=Eleusine coracana subsp. coracana TaxID=191504 RepID=A0AAV5FKC8_ELECO|nr:hypothetical protein QOZ80_5BG0453710 [Eleusine coracana subsp. coracana]GJN36104.1 hypothetical protein PR202_gb24940 [Eleusine coracana subsp. coracana]